MILLQDAGGAVYGTIANILTTWSSLASGLGTTAAVSASNGRTSGTPCIRITINNTGQATNYYLGFSGANNQTFGVAFAFKLPSAPVTQFTLAALYDGGTSQLELRVNTTGTLSIYRSTTVLATSTFVVPAGAWIHYEFKAKIDPSTGTVYLGINGLQHISLTGQNTRNSSNSYANGVIFGYAVISGSPYFATQTLDFCDVVIYDGQTTDANGYTAIVGPIGDCSLGVYSPSGAGTTTNFTPDSGSNYARVNEATYDSDTSYVEDLTINDIDLYATADLAGNIATVKAVTLVHFAKKTDVGTKTFKAALRSNSGNAIHGTENGLSTSYLCFFSPYEQDPNNGSPAAWTPTSFNAAEIGQKVIQ